MRSTVERAPGSRVVLSVQVPPEEMEPDIREACRRLGRGVQVRGFRPGRVPPALVERVVGRERILQEALQQTVIRAYRAALQEHHVEPLRDPQVEIQRFEDGQPLEFRATVIVQPEVVLGDYQGIRIPREVAAVQAEDVEQALEELRQARATWVPVEDEPVAEGHLVVLRTRGQVVDGPAVDESATQGIVGGGGLRPEIDQAIRGHRAGEALDLELSFGPDDPHPALAGKTAHVRVEILAVKRAELPELDDALARQVLEGATSLAELRQQVSRRLQAAAERQADQALAEKALAAAVNGARVELPEALVDEDTEGLLADIRQQVEAAGGEFTHWLALQGKDVEGLRRELRPLAEGRVKTVFVVEAIGSEASLVPSEREIEAVVRRQERQQQSARPAQQGDREGQHATVRYVLLNRRVVRYLAEIAQGVDPETAAERARQSTTVEAEQAVTASASGDLAAAKGTAAPAGEGGA